MIKTKKKIDILKLKEEINTMSEELRELKKIVRAPGFTKVLSSWPSDEAKVNLEIMMNQYQKKRRFTKLVAFRALLRGKIHFHRNTNFNEVDYRFSWKLAKEGKNFPTIEDLEEWTEDVRKEFTL